MARTYNDTQSPRDTLRCGSDMLPRLAPAPHAPDLPPPPSRSPDVSMPVCPALDNDFTFRNLSGGGAPSLGDFTLRPSAPPLCTRTGLPNTGR